VWFGFIGLAAIFYFIPRLTKRPLHSHYLGIFTFWTLALFGSWGGIAPGAPLPSWMAAMSTVAAVLTVVPVLAVAINVLRTIGDNYAPLLHGVAGRFILFGLAAFVLAGFAAAATSLQSVSLVTNFTWVQPAQAELALYGFFGMTMFGAVYFIAPRLLGADFSPKLAGLHFWLAAAGVVFCVVPLALGGVSQGVAMNLHRTGFLEVVLGTLPYLRASTIGDLLLAVGNLLLFLNLAGVLCRVGRSAALAAWAANTAKSAEVVR
jgi:cytochrome c oxidase cbb3-type subunit 1